jgi:glyoxylase-like metal-dependent hydrolase (beta-lactamase superfamily II)
MDRPVPVSAVERAVDRLSELLGEDLTRRVALRRLAGGGLGLAITAGGLRLSPAVAQEASPAAGGAPEIHSYSVGAYTIRIINDGPYTVPAPFLAINAPPQELAAVLDEIGASMEAIDSRSLIMLIETADQRILVDTGFAGGAPETGQLFPALEAEGIALEEIDIVFLTHLHADHYGGALNAAGEPMFPNARYLINRQEREFWDAEPSLAELPLTDDFRQLFREGAKRTITGLGDRLEEIAPTDEIAPGIQVLEAYGHTPGHLAFEIRSEGEALLHIVDAAGHPVLHLEHPDWFLAPDNWPAFELMTRRALLSRAAEEGLLVQTYHFPFPGVGHVTAEGDGWLWEPTM